MEDNQQDQQAVDAAAPAVPAVPEVTNAAPEPQAETQVAQEVDTGASSENGWQPVREASQSVRQDFEVAQPLDKPWQDGDMLLALPGDTPENTKSALDFRPNINIGDTDQGGDWLNNLRAARVAVPHQNWYAGTVLREGAQFRQGVKSEKGVLAAGNMRFNDSGSAKLTGERAVLRIRALTNLGGVIRVPLWHSGFWISIKAPSDGALLELNRRLTEEKITLGRSTYGLAFGNMSVFFAGWVLDFAISHIYDTTLHADIEGDLRKHIDSRDIPLIAWGLACVCWPGGFPYARAVLDPKEGEKVLKEKLNVGKLLWVDNSSLTEWQISHMANYHGQTMTLTALERYRSEFGRGKGRLVELAPGVSITLRNPSMAQYLTSGQRWVNGIVHMVDQAFARPDDDAVRDAYILDQGRATNMRQFTHFVESIQTDGDEPITNEETIEQVLDALSSSDDIRKKYFEAVKSFVEDSAVAVIAIPVTENEDRSSLPRFPHLLVLDVLSVFFILLVQKIPQIQNR